jgi:hypothetical protein
MSDIVPRLDTIEFDQLVEQARGDIPRYAPDWTDHNLHDPGMTLIDLLAWIVDQQVYRAGFVGGRHHRAFAALLGQRSEGPEPARGLVWPSRPVTEGRFIEAGSDVICLQHADLSFALEWPDHTVGDAVEHRSLYVPAAVLTSVGLAVDGVELPAPSPRTDGGSWALGDSGQVAGTVLSLRFDGPLGTPDQVASISLGIEVAPPPGPPLARDDRPWGPVTYSYGIGAAPWVDLEVVHDGTAGLATTGAVILAIPPLEGVGTDGSELRLGLDRGFFPVSPEIRAAALNVIPVVQRERVPAAPLPPGGTGQPDQVVELVTTDLVPPPTRPNGPVLEVEVGGECWEQRPDFSRSGPDDRHYVVQPGHLLFGNGVNGRRPAYGAQISHTELARTRGAAGDVRQGLSWSVPALGVDAAAYGVNRQPLTGGSDGTGAEDLEIAAREAAIQRSALLTDEELVAAAYGLTGMAVGRAEVVAGFDRRLPNRRVDGVRTLVVLPEQPTGTVSDRSPGLVQASQAYLDQVAARLDRRRVLGERLVVQGPVTVAVDLSLTITTEPGTEAGDVATGVTRAVRNRLSALPGPDPVDPWPLGRDLTISEVEAIAARVPGVATVPVVRVAVAGDPPGAGPVPVPPDGLVVAHGVEITVEVAGAGHGHRPSRVDRGGGPSR